MSFAQTLNILYIEDDMQMRDFLTRFLERHDFKVLGADDVDQACALFQTQKIDIAIVDLQLPHQNGMEFIRCLRNKHINTPIIITTAHTENEYLLGAINLDVTRYLVKPFKKSELIEAIEVASSKLCFPAEENTKELHHGYIYDSLNKSIIAPDGSTQQLSRKEYLLLELMHSRKNQIVLYETIEAVVWNNAPMSIDALRTLVRGLRKKSYPDIIDNINRTGYRMNL